MSKSLGNPFLFSATADGVDEMAIRLALLDNHYREDWERDRGKVGRSAGPPRGVGRCAVAPPTGPNAMRTLEARAVVKPWPTI